MICVFTRPVSAISLKYVYWPVRAKEESKVPPKNLLTFNLGFMVTDRI
jgi:hypothetical protein